MSDNYMKTSLRVSELLWQMTDGWTMLFFWPQSLFPAASFSDQLCSGWSVCVESNRLISSSPPHCSRPKSVNTCRTPRCFTSRPFEIHPVIQSAREAQFVRNPFAVSFGRTGSLSDPLQQLQRAALCLCQLMTWQEVSKYLLLCRLLVVLLSDWLCVAGREGRKEGRKEGWKDGRKDG